MPESSTPADAREVAARAYYEWATMNEGERSRWDESGPHRAFALARADVMLGALSDAGLVVVPREPTDAMVEAAYNALGQAWSTDLIRAVLRAALGIAEDT